MNVNVYSVSAINPLEATYYDPFYAVNQYKEVYEQGFAFNKIEALNNTVDSTINNYTTQYLTSKKSIGDIFTIDYTPDSVKTITTPLTFGTIRDLTKYLYIYRDTVQNFSNATTHRVLLTSFTGFKNNINFELEFIGNLYVRVKHNNGDDDFYMNYLQQQDSVVFLKYSSAVSSVTAEGPDTFRYLLDTDGYLQLFKKTDAGNKILTLSAINGDDNNGILSFVDVINAGSYSGTDSIIKINYSIQNFEPKTYSSWVSYDINKQNDLIIDTTRSIFDRTDQYLIHANVNESADKLQLNYVTLTNIRSEKNYIKRGATLVDTTGAAPGVEFREYTSLQTGNNQEKGEDNISLTYLWYDKDLAIKNGTDTYFTAPSSIYPYTRLNINDTKFIDNGSLAGLSPKLSDNIFQLRKSSDGFNNGRYLCTWLSGGNSRERGLWVDRYYYPDYVSKEQALTGIPVFAPSFYDPIDSIDNLNRSTIAAIAYFDKKSDLCIEPNAKYKYSRIGDDDIAAYINSSSPIASGFDSYYNASNVVQSYNSNEIVYTGTTYNKFSVSKQINNSNSFSVSFDIFLDPQKKYGYQILGNNTNKGFGVTSDEQITPFVFTYEGNKIVAYNTNLIRLYTTVFDTQVLDIIKGKGLDDFFVSCNNGNIYKLNTLGVKQKQEQIPEIINYVNYFLTESEIYFLTNSSTNDVVVLDRNTLTVKTITTAKQYKSYNVSTFANDKYSIVVFDNSVYKLAGREIKYFSPTVVYYVVANKTLIRHDIKIDEITYVLESDSEITDFTIDSSYIYILHGDKLVPKLSVFDLSLNLISQTDLTTVAANSSFISIDLIKQFPTLDKLQLSTDIVLTYVDANNELNLYTVKGKATVNTHLIGEKPDTTTNKPYNKRYIATNYGYFNQYDSTTQLNFNLTLTNYLSTEDIVKKTISFDYSVLDRGYHTFTYRFDSIQGNITLFVDGNIYKNLTVQPGKYAIQEILNDDFYAGTAGFYNNMDLATYLKQPGYYFCNDIRLKNLFIYDRPLLDDEIAALDILSTQINDICLSIPAGQRNNIEEIVRYFRYKPTDSSSKQITIYVKNANIVNEALRNNIRNLILEEATSILPVGVNINDIQFVDFK